MKKILRDTCILASLTILSVFVISITWSGITDEIKLVLQLFALSFIISIVSRIVSSLTAMSTVVENFVKYAIATCLVLVFGFIAGWFYVSNFWMVFIYVAFVFVATYLLDVFTTKKDIKYINEKIKERNKK